MKFLSVLVFLLLFPGLSAQITHPKASPFSQLTQEVGLTTLSVEYSRPAARGRKIFGDLVPFGRIWRVGANESTKFTTDTNINVLGNTLAPGTYALYAFPKEEVWEVVFHRNISHWGDGRKAYDPSEDAFRISVEPIAITYSQENFLISFESISHTSAVMEWTWENTKISIPIEVPTETLMQNEIDKKLKDHPSAQTYYEAARYHQQRGQEYQKALDFVKKAIEIGGDTYYFYRVKSLIEAQLGDYKTAINSAKRSLSLAQLEEKDEFVRMNEKNIAAWSQRIK